MVQTGYVVELTDCGAKVRVDRESACGGNCVSCKGCPASAVIVECTVSEKLSIGDEVRLVMDNGSFFKNAALGYGLPIVLMIVGAVVGYFALKSEGASVLGAITGVVLGMMALKIGFKNRKIRIMATRTEI